SPSVLRADLLARSSFVLRPAARPRPRPPCSRAPTRQPARRNRARLPQDRHQIRRSDRMVTPHHERRGFTAFASGCLVSSLGGFVSVSSSVVGCSLGVLIQTASGGVGGSGAPLTKRSGRAA